MDCDLENRGLRFARYADGAIIFVNSRRAGERVMVSLQRFVNDSLRLKVNEHRSAVDRPWKRQFLGITFSRGNFRVKVSEKSLTKLRNKIRELSRRMRGHILERIIADLKTTLLGWKAYFAIAEVLSPLRYLDKWIRRRLRCYVLEAVEALRLPTALPQRDRPAAGVEYRQVGARSLAAEQRSPALYYALSSKYFRGLGLPELAAR